MIIRYIHVIVYTMDINSFALHFGFLFFFAVSFATEKGGREDRLDIHNLSYHLAMFPRNTHIEEVIYFIGLMNAPLPFLLFLFFSSAFPLSFLLFTNLLVSHNI